MPLSRSRREGYAPFLISTLEMGDNLLQMWEILTTYTDTRNARKEFL